MTNPRPTHSRERPMKKTAILSLLTLVFIHTASADNHRIADAEMTSQHVRGPIHMVQGRGGNIAVSVGEDGLLVVDDEWIPLAQKARAALRAISDAPITYLLNTHHHADHTGGNALFGAEAHIIAHSNVRKRLGAARKFDPNSLPVLTFDKSLAIHFNGEEINMIHFPHGHTDSDSIVFFRGSNVVHMGDLLFTTSFPSFYPHEGGDIESYVENVAKIIPMLAEDTIIIAGHGRLATKDDVRAYHKMLSETVDIVRQRIDEGMTKDQARAAGLPERYTPWASNFTTPEQWVGKVYLSLTD